MIRWLKFNAVGIVGAALQLSVLWLLTRLDVHYLLATLLAVETAILHNYAWHTRWTWADRPKTRALWRFHASNGLLSLVSNLILMRVFTGWLGLPVLPANAFAIVLTSIANFFLGDRWVFSSRTKVD